MFEKATAGVELWSIGGDKNFSPTTANGSVALFYWRLRFGGLTSPMERIRFKAPDSLLKLRKF